MATTNDNTTTMGMMNSVLVSFTMVAESNTACPVPCMESHVAAAAVTDEVSFIAVPANSANPSSVMPNIVPNVGNTNAAMTLNRNMTDIDCAITWSSALITGAVAAMAEPPHMDEPTPTNVDVLASERSSLYIR